MKRVLTCNFLIFALIGLAGCPKPRAEFYSVDIDRVDETSPQAKAMIRLSDPQVFSREAMINDRIQQREHLDSLLKESSRLNFEPQMARELSALSALTGQLGISVNPAAGLKFRSDMEEFNRASERAALSHEIEVAKLRAELTRVQRSLKDLEEGKAQSPAAPETKAEKPTAPSAQIEKLGTAITSLIGEIDKTADALSKTLATKAQGSSLKASPEDRYEDLSAYRSRLRADLASASLDDAHDLGGNTLYRLQFRATVLPGANKNKWGVLRVKTRAPDMNDSHVRKLYFTWLAHSTRRLNLVDSNGKIQQVAEYVRIGPPTRLFDIAEIEVKEGKKLSLAVMDGFGEKIEDFVKRTKPTDFTAFKRKKGEYLKDPKAAVEDLEKLGPEQRLILLWDFISDLEAKGSGSLEFKLLRERERTAKAENPSTKQFIEKTALAGIDTAREILQMGPSVEAVVAALGDQGALPKDIRESAIQVLESYDVVYNVAARYLNYVVKNSDIKNIDAAAIRRERNSTENRLAEITAQLENIRKEKRNQSSTKLQELRDQEDNLSKERQALDIKLQVLRRVLAAFKLADTVTIILDQVERIPEAFCKAILEDGTTNIRRVCRKRGNKAAGESFAYSTMPVEQAQRLSTIAGAANSVQMALALAATVPNSGVGIEAGLGSLRNSVGKVDALERAPLVVGFADGGYPKGTTKHAHFGWVFGPQVRLDPKKNLLELRQTVSNYQVTADLSVPSWWPKLHLDTETAWVQNWYDPKELDYLDTSKERSPTKLKPLLPLSQGALDAITDRLFSEIFKQGLRSAQIYDVKPDRVSACADGQVQFLIYGANLWRSPRVYIRGKRHEAVEALPDMAGIAVSFTLKNLPNHGTEDEITVVTQVGSAKRAITIDESCGRPKTQAPTVNVVGNKFIKGQSLTVNVDPDKLPGAALGMMIAVRPAEVGGSISWEKGSGEVTQISPDGKKLTAKPEVNIATPPWNQSRSDGEKTYGDSGTVLEAALLVKLRPEFVPKEFKAQNQVVFYQKEADANATLLTTNDVTDLSGDFTIQLPEVYWSAYPMVASGQARLRGRVSEHDITLDVTPGTLPRDRSREHKFRLEVPAKHLGEYDRLRKQKDLTVKLEFDGQEPFVPQVTGTFKITKVSQ